MPDLASSTTQSLQRCSDKLSTLCPSVFLVLVQPLFICLVFCMSTLHPDRSAPLLTQELYAFHTLRPKYLGVDPFAVLFLLSGIPGLVKLDTFSQPLHFKPLAEPSCLKFPTASKFCILLPNLFLTYFS